MKLHELTHSGQDDLWQSIVHSGMLSRIGAAVFPEAVTLNLCQPSAPEAYSKAQSCNVFELER